MLNFGYTLTLLGIELLVRGLRLGPCVLRIGLVDSTTSLECDAAHNARLIGV